MGRRPAVRGDDDASVFEGEERGLAPLAAPPSGRGEDEDRTFEHPASDAAVRGPHQRDVELRRELLKGRYYGIVRPSAPHPARSALWRPKYAHARKTITSDAPVMNAVETARLTPSTAPF